MMGRDEPEQDSNLEIEVGPLHAPASPASPASPAPADDAKAGRPLLAPRRTQREHLRRGIAVTAGLVVVLVALTLSIAPTREALRSVVFGPTSTATEPLSAGKDSLYISRYPNWGSVALDGHTLRQLPLEGIDLPLRLGRGRHTIHWRFAPILDYTCHLTVPSAPEDNCMTRTGIQPGKKGIASVAMLQLSLLMLAPAYRHSLLVAIQAAFDAQQSSDIVRPGEVYRSDDGAAGYPVVTAHQPLKATLRFVSDADDRNVSCPAITSGPGEGCMMNGDCRVLCTAPWQSLISAPGAAYEAYIVAHPTWRYTTLGGQVVADNAPDLDVGGTSPWYNLFAEQPVPITITWDHGALHASARIGVSTPPGGLPNPVCATAQDEIQSNYLSPPTSAGWGAVAASYMPGNPAAAGCLLVLTVSGQEPLLLLHRFGVLLAVNDVAEHSLGRVLPMADAYERAIAQKLAQQLPAVTGA